MKLLESRIDKREEGIRQKFSLLIIQSCFSSLIRARRTSIHTGQDDEIL